jgi:hypothetical protein
VAMLLLHLGIDEPRAAIIEFLREKMPTNAVQMRIVNQIV